MNLFIDHAIIYSMTTDRETQLIRTLILRGPSQAKQLCSELNISQSTYSLLLKQMKDRVHAFGKGRATRYVATRRVRNLENKIPLFQISEKGICTSIGELLAYEQKGYALLLNNKSEPLLFPGIPYFLSDSRPQGFLGRTFAQKHFDLLLPPRLVDWNEDDTMVALARRSEDSVGNLIIGRESFERYHERLVNLNSQPIENKYRTKAYTKAAIEAIAGTVPGSSAVGEQPKFLTTVSKANHLKHVLVKFSPLTNAPHGRRWADLLIAESIALTLLQENGIESSKTEIIESDGRVFLEVERFDRIGLRGRIGLISLDALDNEWFGKKDNWVAASVRLLENGDHPTINKRDASTLRFLHAFSALIANTDCHFGNISFFWSLGAKQIKLSPSYDILPMLYAPVDGQLVNREFKVIPPKPEAIDEWQSALPLAKIFWNRVSKDSRVSQPFRKIARQNSLKLASLCVE